MTVKVESVIEDRLKEGFLALLTEIAKVCNVEIWVCQPTEEVVEGSVDEGYGHGI